MLKSPQLKPFCLFTGDPQRARLHSWLVRHGVVIIYHQPAWQEALADKLKGRNNIKFSHLFATTEMQASCRLEMTCLR